MNKRKQTRFIHEGKYAAEVEIELIDEDGGWSPYISLEDALMLDEIRLALRKEDIKLASKYGRIYTITPVAV